MVVGCAKVGDLVVELWCTLEVVAFHVLVLDSALDVDVLTLLKLVEADLGT
jgi:hypothetical protein